MKWLNHYRMRLVGVGCLAAVLLGSQIVKADFTFGEPTNLGVTVNTSSNEAGPSISADGLTLIFVSDRPGGSGDNDLWMTKRPTTSDPWTEPANLGTTINNSVYNAGPSISVDRLSLFFTSTQPGGYGNLDLWVSIRPTVDAPWGPPANLGSEINTSANDTAPCLSSDSLTLFFSSDRSGGHGNRDMWVTTRAATNAPWGPPVNLGSEINTSAYENAPSISSDGLTLFFWSDRSGGYGNRDLWMTTRAATDVPWYPAVNVGGTVNTPANESRPNISADGRTLYFWSDRVGGFGGNDIYQTPIIPLVDFNGDGIVDAADMGIMVDHWGENYSFCDIGPMPWGDGIVDVQDLVVLAEHLFEEVNDPTLVAHWPLDEAQGVIAFDSAADRDGTLMGGPVWQPDGGMVAGALQFDGADDYVTTDLVLDPADGAFSVVAWIKGGAPGQAVLSQANGVSWLCTDSVEGCLMTELTNSGRSAVGPMLSQANITDGNWHRIGFVWDGSYRHLYVDGAEVANDAAPLSDLESAEAGLYFGVGSTLAPGTFFSGLIDDVRIHSRATSP